MTNHAKVYLKHFDLGIDSIWQCECCGKQDYIQNQDLHHIHGRGKGMDVIENLMCLCRECHNKAHSIANSKQIFSNLHNEFLRNGKN